MEKSSSNPKAVLKVKLIPPRGIPTVSLREEKQPSPLISDFLVRSCELQGKQYYLRLGPAKGTFLLFSFVSSSHLMLFLKALSQIVVQDHHPRRCAWKVESSDLECSKQKKSKSLGVTSRLTRIEKMLNWRMQDIPLSSTQETSLQELPGSIGYTLRQFQLSLSDRSWEDNTTIRDPLTECISWSNMYCIQSDSVRDDSNHDGTWWLISTHLTLPAYCDATRQFQKNWVQT